MLIGVVGKPSVGKSTFFKAATLAEVEIANYPFTTIKPNHGVGYVSTACADRAFDKQCNPKFGFCLDGRRFIPVDLLDVAGLVPGAHEGKGMGNQFLEDLRNADVLIHIIDVSGSTNEKGEPVEAGSYDPANDVKFLEVELDMWYYQIMKKGWDKFARTVSSEKKPIHIALAKQLSSLKVNEDMVKVEIRTLSLDSDPRKWSDEDLMKLASALRKITKPIIIACNKGDIEVSSENFKKLQEQFKDYKFILCASDYEFALREAAKSGLIEYTAGENNFKVIGDLNDKQKAALDTVKNYLNKNGNTGVQQVLDTAVFDLLGYLAIFPGGVGKLEDSDGNVLPDCFLLPKDSTALDFAFKLHTDFGKGFIKAIDVKTKRTVGKDHQLKNGDVVEIMSK